MEIEGRVGGDAETLLVLGRRGNGLMCQGKDGIHLLLESKAVDAEKFRAVLASTREVATHQTE